MVAVLRRSMGAQEKDGVPEEMIGEFNAAADEDGPMLHEAICVIASEAKQASSFVQFWIASSPCSSQ